MTATGAYRPADCDEVERYNRDMAAASAEPAEEGWTALAPIAGPARRR